MKELADIIATVGFPIAISMFLLFRIEKKMSEMEKSLEDLNVEIKLMKEIVGSCKGRKK